MAVTTAALRSLNTTFVRKGIVAATTGDHEPRDLPSEVLTLLGNLKSECQGVCENARDVSSFIQLWKERSLHQALQALDESTAATATSSSSSGSGFRDGDNRSNSHEKQIQAIEMHEKAGREMNELLQRHRIETTRDMHSRIDSFAEQLTIVLTELVKPELEEELERERAIVHRLVQEKQRLEQAQLSLQQSNQELSSRIESLENAPNGGGDAILCNKLRERVRELTSTKQELLANVAEMEKEREKHRWDMVQMKQELENQQHTFFLTKAMHEKETRQLVALVQNRQAQFAQVMQASSTNGSVVVAAPPGGAPSPLASIPRAANQMKKHQATTVEVYDPMSGHTIQYAPRSPQKPRGLFSTSNNSHGNGSKTGLAFIASLPASPKRKLSTPSSPSNPNQQQRGSLDISQPQATTSALEGATESRTSQQLPFQSRSSQLQSPSGQVRRFVFSDPSQKSL